jgi:hypothetical protein
MHPRWISAAWENNYSGDLIKGAEVDFRALFFWGGVKIVLLLKEKPDSDGHRDPA